MSRQHPQNSDVIANSRESAGLPPLEDEQCPMTGRSASVCDTPDHRNCPDLRGHY